MPKLVVPSKGEFKNYVGVTFAEVVTDEDGTPIINPTREQAAEYMGFSADGKEIEYSMDLKFNNGASELGGVKYTSKFRYDKMSDQEQEEYEYDVEGKGFKVRFLMKGMLTSKESHFFFLDFVLAEGNEITNKGDKMKVFNDLGQSTYVDAEGNYSFSSFKDDEEFNVRPMPRSHFFGMTSEELLNFIYAYAAQKAGNVALVDELNFDTIREGDVSSLVELFELIHTHESMKHVETGKPLYGIKIAFAVKNNKGRMSQDFYNFFERGRNGEGKIKFKFDRLISRITKDRTPNNGYVNSPEKRGLYLGGEYPSWGLTEVDTKEMMEYMKDYGKTGIQTFEESEKVDFSDVEDIEEAW